ncbi:hypothetical protein P8452_24928 [Trifolium repens]|nr:hypothetical protein P8452_24928 [Trifolium repens]
MEEKEEDKSRHKRWMQTTKALLGAVRKETCQPYSIPVVPDDLRKSNETAYMPKVVSVGPGYKVIDLDATVRASYVDVIALDRYELATTMVFDGCFLLELLICESKLDLETPIPFNGISPGIEVKKMEYVVSDLMLLENQIPIFILETLFVKLLGSSNQMREFIQNLALPLFGYSGKLTVKSTSHFLDVAYSYLEMGWMDKKREEIEARLSLGVITKLQPQQRLNRCATRLKAAGITIRSLKNDDDINFKLTTHFDESKGKLEIPRLIIEQTTEVKWRSFIAWEHHKKKLKTGSSSVADRRSICTSSALLFRDLICCSSDVQLLKDRRVIVDQSNKSNRDLRGYNFAAAILSLLTVIQTCYAVIAYHFPKQQN